MKIQNVRNYTEHEVVEKLNRKHDIEIANKTITILYGRRSKGDIGTGSKGKIDFLTRYCGYMKIFVTEFERETKPKHKKR